MPKTLKSLKTPLRYPGGKSRAVVKLLQYLPDLTQVKEFREPFLGGGSVALEITKRYPHIEIWVNDLYEPLYNFWCELQHNGQDLQDAIFSKKNLYPDPDTARKLFNQSKEEINDPISQALIVLWLSILSISVVSVASLSLRHSQNKHPKATSPSMELIDSWNTQSLLKDGQ